MPDLHPIDCRCTACRALPEPGAERRITRLVIGGGTLGTVIFAALTAHWLLPVARAVFRFLFD